VAQADNVSKSVSLGAETIEILREVSLTLYPGRTVSISGTSGSGKTTLLGLLAGLDLPSQGDLSLLGRQLGNLDEDARAELRCGQVGFVFQSFHLLPNLTALENVSLALEVVPGSSDIEQRSMAALQQVGLVARARHLPSQLSGGEQQRVAMARAIVAEPAILFADEPTGNLDHATSDQVIDMIFALCRDNDTALVLVTHDLDLAARCNDQYVIEAGRLSRAQ
jgi:putative ABC transport system ATP-binding protein